ncbi:MAG: hypothetical protein KDI66_07745, partial [Xanthomonadales bacterium]|nr:hypothetical protein [Xanthomonadales bacterium]
LRRWFAMANGAIAAESRTTAQGVVESGAWRDLWLPKIDRRERGLDAGVTTFFTLLSHLFLGPQPPFPRSRTAYLSLPSPFFSPFSVQVPVLTTVLVVINKLLKALNTKQKQLTSRNRAW